MSNYKIVYVIAVVFFSIASLFAFSKNTWAQEYVLPYPGYMPGHPLYKVSQIADWMEEWWSFGSFAKFKYNLSIADKKLVEAKTLFEYKQYLLGYHALQHSDNHFAKAQVYLARAENEGKNISQKKNVLQNASVVHISILENMEREVPETFVWRPEKEPSVTLSMRSLIRRAVVLRKQGL